MVGFVRRIASITLTNCVAPPSGRSSRSTEVTTICSSPICAAASATLLRLHRVDRARHAGLDVAEGAGPRAGVAQDHHRRVLLASSTRRCSGRPLPRTPWSGSWRASARASRRSRREVGALTRIQSGLRWPLGRGERGHLVHGAQIAEASGAQLQPVAALGGWIARRHDTTSCSNSEDAHDRLHRSGRRLSPFPRQRMAAASASAGRNCREGQSTQGDGHRLLGQPRRSGADLRHRARARSSWCATSPTSCRRSKPAAGATVSRAALEFAVTQLEVEEIVVLGHGACGGVNAALTRSASEGAAPRRGRLHRALGRPARRGARQGGGGAWPRRGRAEARWSWRASASRSPT